MKVYLGIKFHPDNRNRDRIELISQALSLYGCEIVCIRRDIEQWGAVQLASRELMSKTFEVIRACQLVVIDLTEKGVGVGIEAGYAYAQRIPVITIARAGADISNTLQGISRETYLYRSVDDLKGFFSSLRPSDEQSPDTGAARSKL